MISSFKNFGKGLDNKGIGSGVGLTTQLIILVNGIILTAIIFWFLTLFTKQVIDDEQVYVSNHAVQSFEGAALSLNKTLFNLSNVVIFSKDAGGGNQSLIQSSLKTDNYDALWYARDDGNGQWFYDWLYPEEVGNASALFRLLKDNNRVAQEVMAYTQAQNIIDNRVFLFQSSLRDKNTGNRLVFLTLKRQDSAGKTYLFFGLLDINKIFELSFRNASKYMGSVSLAMRDDSEQNWHYKLLQGSNTANGFDESFLLDLWQHQFQMSLTFNQMHKLYFLKQIPLYFGALGVLLTFFSVLFVRNRYVQALRLKTVNKKLANKNMELRKEAASREQLNEVLEQSEKENRSIIDAVSDIIFETDIDGNILFLSAAWKKITAMDTEKFIGTEIFATLHPKDQQEQINDFQLLIRGQKQKYRSFTRIKTADGTFRAVEIAVSMIRQDRNNNLRVVGTFTDVEERKRAERALGEAEKKYRTIVENAAGGIYQLTIEGIYLSANPAMARILGYESPEQILRDVKAAFKTIYVNSSEREDIVKELRDGANFYNCETEMFKKDGTQIWVSENIRAVRDDSDNILYLEGSIEDITKRKESEIALREAKVNSDLANRAKSEFLANMSHELRTPLNSIIGFSEIIKNEVFGPIEQKSYWEYAKHINESGQNLLKVINEILDISRIEAGNRQLNESKIDIEEIAENCLDMMSAKIENNQMNIVNSLSGVPNFKGEELAIKQILMNILSNSIKFTPSGGRITLSYDVDSHGELRISVTDTGIGLEESQIEKALSPFGQVNSNLDRNESGTGLGLTLVNALIKMHNGRFELLSQKGIGTTATIILPVDRVLMKKEDLIDTQSLATKPQG